MSRSSEDQYKNKTILNGRRPSRKRTPDEPRQHQIRSGSEPQKFNIAVVDSTRATGNPKAERSLLRKLESKRANLS
jgi:hypothetical protein